MSNKAKLFQKMVKVMETVGAVSKGNEVTDRNGKKMYDYVSEEHITKKVHDACVEHGLVFYPVKTESEVVILEGENYGKPFKTPVTKVIVTYELGDAETGETISVQSIGYGADSQDKGSNKAMTGAFKYAQRQTFLISTGDDPDHTPNHELDRINKEEADRQNEIARKREENEKKKLQESLASPQQKNTISAFVKQIAGLRGVETTDVMEKLYEQVGEFKADTLREATAQQAVQTLNKWLVNAKKEVAQA